MTSLDWENDDEDWGSETEDKWDVVVNGANDFECDDEPKDQGAESGAKPGPEGHRREAPRQARSA